jgi:hypothetical protein
VEPQISKEIGAIRKKTPVPLWRLTIAIGRDTRLLKVISKNDGSDGRGAEIIRCAGVGLATIGHQSRRTISATPLTLHTFYNGRMISSCTMDFRMGIIQECSRLATTQSRLPSTATSCQSWKPLHAKRRSSCQLVRYCGHREHQQWLNGSVR